MPQAGHGYISDQMIERRNADGQAALVAALSRYEDTSHAPHDVVALRATLADLGPLLNGVTYEVRGGEVGVVGFVSASYHCVMGWLGPEGSVQTWLDYKTREGKCQPAVAFAAVPTATGR